MIVKHRKRPRDPIHLGKLVGDILTGQVENRAPASPKDEGNVGALAQHNPHPSPKIYYLHPLMIGPSCASPRTRPRRSLQSDNMTPVPRHFYRIGVPRAGIWREIFNSDSGLYCGSNMGNAGAVHTIWGAMHGEQQSLDLVLPPLSTVLLRHEG